MKTNSEFCHSANYRHSQPTDTESIALFRFLAGWILTRISWYMRSSEVQPSVPSDHLIMCWKLLEHLYEMLLYVNTVLFDSFVHASSRDDAFNHSSVSRTSNNVPRLLSYFSGFNISSPLPHTILLGTLKNKSIRVRWMCGVSKKDRRLGKDLFNLLGIQSVADVVSHGRLSWFVILSMRVKMIGCGPAEGGGEKCRGRDWKTWWECVRKDKKLFGCNLNGQCLGMCGGTSYMRQTSNLA